MSISISTATGDVALLNKGKRIILPKRFIFWKSQRLHCLAYERDTKIHRQNDRNSYNGIYVQNMPFDLACRSVSVANL